MLPLTPFVLSLGSVLALIAVTPDPIAIHLGPVPVFWYGVCYAIGLAADLRRHHAGGTAPRPGRAARRQRDHHRRHRGAARWPALPRHRPVAPVPGQPAQDLPAALHRASASTAGSSPASLAAWYLTRRWHQSFWSWADVIAPGLFVMQAIGRWGNFFNQELYGPPTDLPWGITIDCAHRVGDHGIAQWPCDQYPVATTGFHPLFLYESLSGVLGAITLLWIARRWGSRMRPGDLFLIFFIWYGAVRFALETFRTGNWTFFGVADGDAGVRRSRSSARSWCSRIGIGPGAAGGDRWGEPPGPRRRRPDDDDGRWVDGRRGGRRRTARSTRRTTAGRRGRPARARRATRVTTPRPRLSRPDRAAPPTAGRPSRRRPAARTSPEALAAARGGIEEGLAWLGREPESRALAALPRCCGSWRAPSCSARFRFRIDAPRAGAPARRRAATSSSPRPIAAGWTRSS